jgi:hypothetical protein
MWLVQRSCLAMRGVEANLTGWREKKLFWWAHDE